MVSPSDSHIAACFDTQSGWRVESRRRRWRQCVLSADELCKHWPWWRSRMLLCQATVKLSSREADITITASLLSTRTQECPLDRRGDLVSIFSVMCFLPSYQVFEGNSHYDTPEVRRFDEIITQYMRVFPERWSPAGIGMRMEVLGCDLPGKNTHMCTTKTTDGCARCGWTCCKKLTGTYADKLHINAHT